MIVDRGDFQPNSGWLVATFPIIAHRVQVTHGVLARSEHEPLVNGVPKRGATSALCLRTTHRRYGCRKLWDRGDESMVREGVMSVTRSVWRFSENACSSWKLRWMPSFCSKMQRARGEFPGSSLKVVISWLSRAACRTVPGRD